MSSPNLLLNNFPYNLSNFIAVFPIKSERKINDEIIFSILQTNSPFFYC